MCEVDFNAHAETYTSDPHVNKFGELACEKLYAQFPTIVPVSQGSTALDFGTGGGNVAFRLRAQGVGRVVALDTAENMIKVVKRKIAERDIQGVIPFLGSCEEYLDAAGWAPGSGAPFHSGRCCLS
jgi:ubiquinone/menaquinone biosynthesis C-methylase UbiE